MEKKKTYSLAKVAAELGVSKATVSVVLSGKARKTGISVELEERIRAFCREVNYQPNIHARRLNQKQVRNVGVLIDKRAQIDAPTPLADYNIANVIGGIAAEADVNDYRFSFQLYSEGMNSDRVFDWFRSREIDGLIFYGFEMPEAWIEIIKAEKLSVVGVSIAPEKGIPSVNVNNLSASQEIAEHLIVKCGRKDFLYIGAPLKSYPGGQRYMGFLKALKKHNIAFDESLAFFDGEFSREKAEEIVRGLKRSGRLTADAIVCANDNMALGALTALREAGVAVPDQLSVVGADNINTGHFTIPSLTTFDYLPFEQGKRAFSLLFDMIQTKKTPKDIVLETIVRYRDSA